MTEYRLKFWNIADFHDPNMLLGPCSDLGRVGSGKSAVSIAANAESISVSLRDTEQNTNTFGSQHLEHGILGEPLTIGAQYFGVGSVIVPETVVEISAPACNTLVVCRIYDPNRTTDGGGLPIVFASSRLLPGQQLCISAKQTAPGNGPGQNCFARGTLIETPHGEQPIENLEDGDEVLTHDGKSQLISWIGSRRLTGVELVLSPHLQPVRIKAGALAGGRPGQDLVVSQNHRLMVDDWRAPFLFGEEEILVPARSLLNNTTVLIDCPMGGIDYFHLLMDCHAMVCANGLWAETMLPDNATLAFLSPVQRAEISAHLAHAATDYQPVIPAMPHQSAASVVA